jgi:transposase
MTIFSATEYLPGWEVLELSASDESHVIKAKYIEIPDVCPLCGSMPAKLYRHGTRNVRFFDQPLWGKPVHLVSVLPRYRCRDCGGTFTPYPAGVDPSRRLTSRCVEFVIRESLTLPAQALATQVGCSPITIRRTINAHIAACLETPSTHDNIVAKSGFLSRHTGSDAVTETDIALWLIVIPRIHPRLSRMRTAYVRNWLVHEKILAAKQDGSWAEIRLKGLSLAADLQLLPYLSNNVASSES